MSEIDDLMNLDPLQLSARDIDTIIAYERKMAGGYVPGQRPAKEAGPKRTLDLATLGLVKPKETIKRRI